MQPKILAGFCVLLTLCASSGCGRAPQVHASNRKILEALQTAVSAKKMEWLEIVVNQVAEKRSKQEMSDAEFVAIDSIVKTAKIGNWKQAQKDSFALSEAQRPTSGDLAMLKNQKSSSNSSPN